MDPVIEASQLTKRYGSLVALDALDLRVDCGGAYGLVGGSGAGKTTLVRLLAGLATPTRGTVRILGRPPAANDRGLRRRMGLMPERLEPFDYLTGAEYLAFLGRQFSLEKTVARRRAAELLSLVDLRSAAEQTIVGYSHSMRQKLALCAALVHRPELLILDDPFQGVDTSCRRIFERLLKETHEPGVTVFLTSTSISVAEGVCSRVERLDQGRILGGEILGDVRAATGAAALAELRSE